MSRDTKIKMDESRLVPFASGHVFLALEGDVKEALSPFPGLLDRIQNAVEFAVSVGGEKEPRWHAAMVRGALAELVSIEDLQREMRSAGELSSPVVRMDAGDEPILCVARELRHLEMHLVPSVVIHEKRKFLWGSADPAGGREVEVPVHFIKDLSVERFVPLRNFSRYDGRSFKRAVCWFDDMQKQWGISECLFRAAATYARLLASCLRARRQA